MIFNKKLKEEIEHLKTTIIVKNELLRVSDICEIRLKKEIKTLKSANTRLTNKLKTKEDIIQDFIKKGYNAGYINLLKQEDYEKLKKEGKKCIK